eukprot:540725_1
MPDLNSAVSNQQQQARASAASVFVQQAQQNAQAMLAQQNAAVSNQQQNELYQFALQQFPAQDVDLWWKWKNMDRTQQTNQFDMTQRMKCMQINTQINQQYSTRSSFTGMTQQQPQLQHQPSEEQRQAAWANYYRQQSLQSQPQLNQQQSMQSNASNQEQQAAWNNYYRQQSAQQQYAAAQQMQQQQQQRYSQQMQQQQAHSQPQVAQQPLTVNVPPISSSVPPPPSNNDNSETSASPQPGGPGYTPTTGNHIRSFMESEDKKKAREQRRLARKKTKRNAKIKTICKTTRN